MEQINYSVVIRTIGKAGEKYQKLLESIDALIPKPQEVIVVLPEGFKAPSEQLGSETFLYVPRGMVRQRLEGINQCKTKYALVCDDDVSFPADFVQRLEAPIRLGEASISAAPLYSFLPDTKAHILVDAIMGRAVPTVFHKNRYVSVLRTSGYSYNKHLDKAKTYEAQSLPWTCFFADVEALKKINLEEETWLEKKKYAAMDDQTMFYKAWLRNIKTVVVADAEYEHLDARTSVSNTNMEVPYALHFNRVVFWHRFIYLQQKGSVLKLWSRAAFAYRKLGDFLYDYYCYKRRKYTKEQYLYIKRAWKDASAFIRGEEYRGLPGVL